MIPRNKKWWKITKKLIRTSACKWVREQRSNSDFIVSEITFVPLAASLNVFPWFYTLRNTPWSCQNRVSLSLIPLENHCLFCPVDESVSNTFVAGFKVIICLIKSIPAAERVRAFAYTTPCRLVNRLRIFLVGSNNFNFLYSYFKRLMIHLIAVLGCTTLAAVDEFHYLCLHARASWSSFSACHWGENGSPALMSGTGADQHGQEWWCVTVKWCLRKTNTPHIDCDAEKRLQIALSELWPVLPTPNRMNGFVNGCRASPECVRSQIVVVCCMFSVSYCRCCAIDISPT